MQTSTQRISVPSLEGQDFLLRPATAEDVLSFSRIERDPFIHRMFGGNAAELRSWSDDEVRVFVQRLIQHPSAWVIDVGGAIGEIRLDRIDMRDRRASFAVGILDAAWLGKGIGTGAARLVLDHAFRTLRLHRISLRVLAYNTRAIRSYQKCGFTIEGREREAGFVDGEWHDDLIMGLLDREFFDIAKPQSRDGP